MKYTGEIGVGRWLVGGGLLVFLGIILWVSRTAVFATEPPQSNEHWFVGLGGNAARNSFSRQYGPAEPLLLWRGGEPATIARQPVVADGVVVMERIQSLADLWHGTQLVAHDLQTGDLLWSTELPVDFESDWTNRISAVRDGRVFASRSGSCGNKAYLYALDLYSGAALWRSEALIDECSTEGAAFASNGDLLVGNHYELLRIAAETGKTVWRLARSCPTSGGCGVAVWQERAYMWEVRVGGPVLTAVSLAAGQKLYETAVISPGIIQQVVPFVGLDGTVYAPRTQNDPDLAFLVAFTDTGSGLVEKWRVPLGYVPYASFGVGPDGSVYSYGQDNRLLRLAGETGAVLNRSPLLTTVPPLHPRLAVDVLGQVFVTNGSYEDGRLFAFTPELDLLWETAVPRVNLCGPTLGLGGVLVVCGVGNDVRAYQAEPVVTVTPMPTETAVPPANHERRYFPFLQRQ